MVAHPTDPNLQGNDRKTADEVVQRLENDPDLHGHRIVVSVLNNVVTLKGSVKSPPLANRAVELVSSAPGVQAVVNQIAVVPAKRPDADILHDVQAALKSDPATAAMTISAEVKDAVVSLTGIAETWEQKDVARWVAEGVPGVRNVRNDVRISFTERPDNDIAQEVRRRLATDAQVSDRLIVNVGGGVVHLVGQVGDALERTLAVADGWVEGVRDVDGSGLRVVSGTHPSQTGPEGTALTDAQIRQAVLDRYRYDPRVRAARPDVQVANGVVTLDGSVGDARAKEAAGDLARHTRGVRSVRNQLRVGAGGPSGK